MGAPFIDYVLADPVALPMDRQQYYDEKIVHLPVSYQPNSSTREMPECCYSRTDSGLPQDGFVFCCFNTSYKISPDVFGLWMRLLASVRGSVLWLAGTNPLVEANLKREATGHGIDPTRLLFAPRASYSDYLARCAVADLFLDTCPYGAGATASDALWAGLPLVTRMGPDFAGRMAASVLTAVGLSELITETDGEYEELALRLATEPAEMHRVRASLQVRSRTSGMFDAVRVTRHLEAAYEEMWRRHCASETPDNFVLSDDKPGATFNT
jgi:predicted O-linked N-acetylglucosamine transferase (SPINDLY family)